MAGLNSLVSNAATQTTTMPSWYDQAQQNVVNQATTGAAAVPALQNTVAGQAINNLTNPSTNPFTQAQSTLGTIASGAANPWITSPTGTVTPNTATPLGGLFQAQNQQLQNLIPTTEAPVNAGAISQGQFGSLRNQTAADTALAQAQANLTAQQMQAALQNQQTGVAAGTGLGNVGAQGTATETTLGQAQQASPLTATADLANILGTIKAPTTVTNQMQYSPLSLLTGLGGLVGVTPQQAINSVGQSLSGLFGNIFNSGISSAANSAVTQIPNTAGAGQPGYGWQYFSDGTSISPSGQYYQGGNLIYDPSQYNTPTNNTPINPGSDPSMYSGGGWDPGQATS